MGGPWDFGLALVWFRRSSSLYNIFFLFWEEKHKRTRQEETNTKSQLKFQLEIPENFVEVFTFFKKKFERHQITEQNLHRLLPVTIYYEVSIYILTLFHFVSYTSTYQNLLKTIAFKCQMVLAEYPIILCPQSSQEANCNSNYH